jgi:hypothetical protein
MPNPRDEIIQNLNQKLDHFFGAGKTVQEIASGVSAEVPMFTTTHSKSYALSGTRSRRG